MRLRGHFITGNTWLESILASHDLNSEANFVTSMMIFLDQLFGNAAYNANITLLLTQPLHEMIGDFGTSITL